MYPMWWIKEPTWWEGNAIWLFRYDGDAAHKAMTYFRMYCNSFPIVLNINHAFSNFEEILTHFKHIWIIFIYHIYIIIIIIVLLLF
jgi:hypothetical protein